MSFEPINKDFYEKSKAFMISALALLISYLEKGERIPYRLVEETKIENDGSWSTPLLPQYEYFRLVEKYTSEIRNLPEYLSCIATMSSDAIIAKHMGVLVGTWNSLMTRNAPDYLFSLLYIQLSLHPGRIEFDPKSYDSTYHDLEQFFYEDLIEMEAFSPLSNFNCDTDKIELGEGLRIRRVTINEQEQLMDNIQMLPLNYLEIPSLKYAIDFSYMTKKLLEKPPVNTVMPPDIDANVIFDKLILTLRLFKKGTVSHTFIRIRPIAYLPLSFGGVYYGLPVKRSLLGVGAPYSLSSVEEENFNLFWDDLKKINLNQPTLLDLALRRFSFAYERDNLEDKLVDYMISFEALFFKEGEYGEFRHKLSTRVARFLYQEFDQRKQIVERMNEFYNQRGKIVHGERVELKNEFVESV